MSEKIKLGACLLALSLFAFPWLQIERSEKKWATQTGIQVITGEATPYSQIDYSQSKTNAGRKLGSAPLIAIALLAVFSAAVFSMMTLVRGNMVTKILSSALPAASLICILVQIKIDFPALNELKESVAEKSIDYSSISDPYEGFSNFRAAAIMSSIQVKIKPALYLQLFILAIPTLLLANNLIDLVRKRTLPSRSG